MKKIVIILFAIVCLAGCAVYSNDKTYYGSIEFRNNTSTSVTIALNGSPTSEADTMSGIQESLIEPDETRIYTVSWQPGNYSVLGIDGIDEDNASAKFDYVIKSDNLNYSGELGFTINKSGIKYLSLYKIPLEIKYSFPEFQNLINLIPEREDKNIITNLYFQYYNPNYWEINIYKFLNNTRFDNDKTINTITIILDKYSIPQKDNFLCLESKD